MDFSDGLRFECKQCSACCRFDPGYTFISDSEISNIAKFLNMKIPDFLETYCSSVVTGEGVKISLRELSNYDCIFWKNGCSIYPVRPIQCRTFPFWPSILKSKEVWNSMAKDCPGINSGKLFSKDEIQKQLDLFNSSK